MRDRSAVDELKVTVVSVGDSRDTSFGKVQSVTAKDDSGSVQLSLWRDDVGKFQENDAVVIKNGWCKDFRGQLQVSAGKLGSIAKV